MQETVGIKIFAKLQKDEHLMIVGETEETGNWNPVNAKVLSPAGDSFYETTLESNGSGVINYKYCIKSLSKKNVVKWENGGNRVGHVGVVSQDHAFEHGQGAWLPCQFPEVAEPEKPEIKVSAVETKISTKATEVKIQAKDVKTKGKDVKTQAKEVKNVENTKEVESWEQKKLGMSPVTTADSPNSDADVAEGEKLNEMIKDLIPAQKPRRGRFPWVRRIVQVAAVTSLMVISSGKRN